MSGAQVEARNDATGVTASTVSTSTGQYRISNLPAGTYSVAEFTVLQNQFSPEYGHSAGGQCNQMVKSGTNQLHGSAYEYFMNRNLNAADNLSAIDGTPLHPRYDDNRFGGTVGGPIRKDKLFFFVDYEYNPIGASSTAA